MIRDFWQAKCQSYRDLSLALIWFYLSWSPGGGCSCWNSGNNKSPRVSPGIPDCTHSDQESRVLRKQQTTTSVCLSAFLARRLSIKQSLGCKPQLPADLVSEQIWQETHSKALLTTQIYHPAGNNSLFSNSYTKLLGNLYTGVQNTNLKCIFDCFSQFGDIVPIRASQVLLIKW